MLRERTPKLVIFALKWCKALTEWLDHAYKNFIWVYSDNNERLEATRVILGWRNRNKEFKFEDTIDWSNLTDAETKHWKIIQGWVSWFQKQYVYIENEYCISKQKGVELVDIKYNIMLNYLLDMCPKAEDDAETKVLKNKKVNELVDFLFDCFEERIKR